MATQRWIPLESNPKVLNKYIENLGASKKWQFVDVYGLDDELLMMVPKPVAAVMLLYPLTEKVESNPIGVSEGVPSSMYFMHQTIGNACGTVALVHALANNADKLGFADDKHFKEFLEVTKDMTPEEKATHLEKDAKMGAAHEESAQDGDTEAPSRDEKVRPHFVVFVNFKETLYEMDGRKPGPVPHGPTTKDTLLNDTVAVVKKFIARDPEEINFTLMALACVEE